MNPILLNYLCDPETFEPLRLVDAEIDEAGRIQSGLLLTSSARRYPIRNGIPRFVDYNPELRETVTSFGDEWNTFDFAQWKTNWLAHTVANTFGSTAAFDGKLIVDCGGGSGAQSRWFVEYGAKHVIMLELSHAVDGIVTKNIGGLENVDIIQCSIDAPPLRRGSIDGIVYCHNVIQHTASVEKTAGALFKILAPNGEFVFNCYKLNDEGLARWLRHNAVYLPLRFVLSRLPFKAIQGYATLMAYLRSIPWIGFVVEASGLASRGEVVPVRGESTTEHRRRSFEATKLNTFDKYGSHAFQHTLTDEQLKTLVHSLQPNSEKVLNTDAYFSRPPPIGCALRVFA